jgi:hypothetical protein
LVYQPKVAEIAQDLPQYNQYHPETIRVILHRKPLSPTQCFSGAVQPAQDRIRKIHRINLQRFVRSGGKHFDLVPTGGELVGDVAHPVFVPAITVWGAIGGKK